MSNIVNLLPVILVAVGALASLAAEPFLKDENKHKVLPWVASFFVALAAGAYFLTTDDTIMNLYAMDPIRRVLGASVVLCASLVLRDSSGLSVMKSSRVVRLTACCCWQLPVRS